MNKDTTETSLFQSAEGEQAPASRQRQPTHKGDSGHSPSPTEVGGPSGAEPTRYGDWEKNGRCIDF